jgi:beta-lactamase regulating signal transducer with metallopeptidase domain
MIAAWMAYVALWTVWLALTAVGIERALLRARLPVRGVWTVALLLSVASPFVGATIARRPEVVSVIAPPAPVVASTPMGDFVASAAVPSTTISVRDAFVQRLAAADRPLLIGWIALSMFALVYVLGGVLHLRYLRRRWRSQIVNGVPVMVSDDVGPAVVGVARSTLVIPEWALALEPEAVSLMLAHELEHQRAGDVRLLALARAASIAMPWNVGLWWQVRRLRAAVELDCDARVLASTSNVRLYGQLLLECGRPRRAPWLAGTSFAGHKTQLERRIRLMTQPHSRGRAFTAAMCGIAGGVAFLVACSVPAPQSPALREPGVASVVPVTDSVYIARLREWRKLADSVLKPANVPDTGEPLLKQYFDARRIIDTSTDPAVRTAYQRRLMDASHRLDSLGRSLNLRQLKPGPLLDQIDGELDSVRHELSRAQSWYSSSHPAVRVLQERIGRLVSLRSGGDRGLQLSPGCTTNEFVNRSLVRLVVDDSAEYRSGRVLFRSQAATRRGISVRAKTDAGSVMCQADLAEIRVFGLAQFDGPSIVVESSTRTALEVVTTYGRVLSGPIVLENAAKQYELTWLPVRP